MADEPHGLTSQLLREILADVADIQSRVIVMEKRQSVTDKRLAAMENSQEHMANG